MKTIKNAQISGELKYKYTKFINCRFTCNSSSAIRNCMFISCHFEGNITEASFVNCTFICCTSENFTIEKNHYDNIAGCHFLDCHFGKETNWHPNITSCIFHRCDLDGFAIYGLAEITNVIFAQCELTKRTDKNVYIKDNGRFDIL